MQFAIVNQFIIKLSSAALRMYMLWLSFIFGLNFIFLCFKLIIIHHHTQNQKNI